MPVGGPASASGDRVIVGDVEDDERAPDAGAAFIFGPLSDGDSDGVPDLVDNCRGLFNPNQVDTDENGTGDLCNDFEDLDGDEWADLLDNSPGVFNPGQEDRDRDGVGDVSDPFPDDPRTEQAVAILFEDQAAQDQELSQLAQDVDELVSSDQDQNMVAGSRPPASLRIVRSPPACRVARLLRPERATPQPPA